MSMAKRSILNKKRVWIISGLLFLLAACRPPASTIKIRGNIIPDPIVGQVTTLVVEIEADHDTDTGLLQITLPEEINLIAGNLEWNGKLKANEPYIHKITICVLQPVHKQILLGGGTGTDGERTGLFVISTISTAEVIPASEYRFFQPSPNSTATPIPPKVTVSKECLGEN